jgi:hypothetical protein
MIFENRCLIEPSDFISVQYECDKCGSAIIVPIDKLDQNQFAIIAKTPCQHCSTPTGFANGTDEMKAFLVFNDSLKQIVSATKGRNLKLRLRIKCPE